MQRHKTYIMYALCSKGFMGRNEDKSMKKEAAEM